MMTALNADKDTVALPSRTQSLSPSISPTRASSICPPLDRSFSLGSEVSVASSRCSNVSNTSNTSRRRGYVRPLGATFAQSARNRDSVMSLGSIAHLQYYFARTGLLDGKGAQLARERKKPMFQESVEVVDSGYALPGTPSSASFDGHFPNAAEEEAGYEEDWEIDPMMLAPTVSTYNHKEQYVSSPPDTETLRQELKDCLDHVSVTLSNVRSDTIDKEARAKELLRSGRSTPPFADESARSPSPPSLERSPGRGWHEIQGMHVLDVVTLAIRAAKDYYTMHEHPLRLNKVKSERQIREELLGVMDVLKRMGTRNFAGGMREEEITVIEKWVYQVEVFLHKEAEVATQELEDRQSWQWLEGDWPVNDRLREWEFMKTFATGEDLPPWNFSDSTVPSSFLQKLSNGLTLISIHNNVLKRSKRQFGEIKFFHTDFAKHYRAAENLRFWLKAAEIRWETKLELDVMSLVYNKNSEVWSQFETALMQWCKTIREEITAEWKAGSVEVGTLQTRRTW